MKKLLTKSLAVCLSVMFIVITLIAPAAASAINEEFLSDYIVVSEKEYTLVGGVTEREIVLDNIFGTHQNYLFVLEIAPDNDNVSFVAGYNDGDADEWGKATVRDQAHALEERRDMEIVASVNGGFHSTKTGEPSGILIMEGEIKQKTNGYPFFGVTKDGTPVIRNGNANTDDIQEAIAGYCYLVQNSKVVASETGKLAPRTAVGLRNDGTVVIVVNDGRQDPYSYGMDNDEIAEVMLALGCYVAINLDGGASSTYFTQREGTDDITIRNQPSNGYERSIATSLHIYTTATATGKFDHIVFDEPQYDCVLNKSVTLDVYAVDENGFKTDFPDGGYLVVSDESYGTVKGTKFTATSNEGTVTVSYVLNGEVLASTEVTTYSDNFFFATFRKFSDFFNRIRLIMERLVEEFNERVFGI